MAGRESSESVPKRRSRSRSGGGNWPAELLLWLAFVYFAATAAFYTGQVVIVSICQLVDLMKLQLSAFGVQIVPFFSIDNLPHLSYLSMTALPWGLAALGVFTGFKLLLVPIQICKIHLAYFTISVAVMNWESNFKKQVVVLAAVEAFDLALLFLVFLVMACAFSHRTLFSLYIGTGGKNDVQLREVKINVQRVEEGEVDTTPRSSEAEKMKEKLQTLLWKKEEQLLAAQQGFATPDGVTAEVGVAVETASVLPESRSIYPVLNVLPV